MKIPAIIFFHQENPVGVRGEGGEEMKHTQACIDNCDAGVGRMGSADNALSMCVCIWNFP